ncbi:MAG: multidrug effflux MFS transporter [Leucobacter sp.]|nr:multidrug effflux MFS transporter [Leucobacter sp.]
MQHTPHRNSPKFVIALASVVALGPFAIDTYLASLPSIGAEFGAPDWATQLTLTGYLIVLGLGQIIAGPLTDAVGRRRPILLGISVFILASVIAAVAPSMAVLVIARLLQGAGAAVAFVSANSAVRDRATGDAATQLFSVLMSVGMVAPILAPVLGGFIDEAAGWRAVFFTLAGIGVLALLVVARFLPEPLAPELRTRMSLRPILRGYGAILRNRAFLLPLSALIAAFVMLFSYLGGASYVYQSFFGLSAGQFGIAFAGSALIGLAGPILAHRLVGPLGTVRLMLLGAVVMFVGPLVALVGGWAGAPLWSAIIGLGIALLGLGLLEPPLMALCMSAITEGVGSASALIGAAQYLLGAVATSAVVVAAAAGAAVWITTLIGISLAALLLSLAVARRASSRP